MRGLHEAAYFLASFSILSTLIALFRDRIFAHLFGVSTALDVYYAAFKIPDIIFVSIASIVSVSVLVPFIVEKRDDPLKEKRLIQSILMVFGLMMVIVSAIAWVSMPYLISVFFPNLPQLELVSISRIMLLQPILLGFSNFFGSIAQSHNRFVSYASAPIFYNLGIVLGAIIFAPSFGIYGLAYGVVLGALFHFLLQVPFIFSRKFLFPFHSQLLFREVKEVFLLSLPRTFGLAVSSIAVFFLTVMASKLHPGSISAFNFSWNIQSVPLAVIGVSYSLAAFPTLSRCITNGDKENFVKSISTALKHIVFWSMPIAFLFIILRAQIIRTILGTGMFDWEATRLTAAALAVFSVSVLAQGVIVLLVRGYYAAGKTFIPLIINITGSILVVFFSWLGLQLFREFGLLQFFLEDLLRIEGVPGSDLIMIILGYTLGTLFTAIILLFYFEKLFKGVMPSLYRVTFHSFGASLIMAYGAYFSLNVLDNFLNVDTLVGIFTQGLISGFAGICLWILVLFTLDNPELKEVVYTIKNSAKLKKTVIEDEHIA